MTDTLKVLGQISPTATTLTTLYTVPAATQTTVSSIMICNTTIAVTTFSVSVAIAGAGDAIYQYLWYVMPLNSSDTFLATLGITLATTDVVRIWANNNNVAFNMFGVEIT